MPSLSSIDSSRFDIGVCGGVLHVTAALELAGRATGEDHRQRIVIVLVAVAHAAAVEHHRMIEQVPSPSGVDFSFSRK